MNNKAFTLIEILIVIVIIGLIGGIGVISFNTIFNNAENNYYKVLEKNILLSANDYIEDHREEIPVDEAKEILILELINSKYIEPLKDKNGNSCDGGKVYVYRNDNNKVDYKVCLVCNDYQSSGEYCDGES